MVEVGPQVCSLTSCSGRFKVDGFWPKESETHKIPFDREDIQSELERLRNRRLALRAQRVEEEAHVQGRVTEQNGDS